MQLDPLDLRILSHLQEDGGLTNVELARRVHLSPSPCLARVKALESQGVIERYVALASAKALGLGLNVFINISLKEQSKSALADFEQRIAEHDEVMECYLMTGDSDYLIRVAVADMEALERFILEQLDNLPDPKPRKLPADLAPNAFTIALIEGHRGEIAHVLCTDSEGRISQVKIKDPSFHNWHGLALAVRENGISDFPLCNKSFDLSYAGHDL